MHGNRIGNITYFIHLKESSVSEKEHIQVASAWHDVTLDKMYRTLVFSLLM